MYLSFTNSKIIFPFVFRFRSKIIWYSQKKVWKMVYLEILMIFNRFFNDGVILLGLKVRNRWYKEIQTLTSHRFWSIFIFFFSSSKCVILPVLLLVLLWYRGLWELTVTGGVKNYSSLEKLLHFHTFRPTYYHQRQPKSGASYLFPTLRRPVCD